MSISYIFILLFTLQFLYNIDAGRAYGPCKCYMDVLSAGKALIVKRQLADIKSSGSSQNAVRQDCHDKCKSSINNYIDLNLKMLCQEVDEYFTKNNEDLSINCDSRIKYEYCYNQDLGCFLEDASHQSIFRSINCFVRVSKCDCGYDIFKENILISKKI